MVLREVEGETAAADAEEAEVARWSAAQAESGDDCDVVCGQEYSPVKLIASAHRHHGFTESLTVATGEQPTEHAPIGERLLHDAQRRVARAGEELALRAAARELRHSRGCMQPLEVSPFGQILILMRRNSAGAHGPSY